jgi:ATP-dependent RNA helicase DDX55/SPB4
MLTYNLLSLNDETSFLLNCSHSYRWKELEIGKLATGHGLLQLPLVPEVKRHSLSTEGFEPVKDINFEDIKFR